MMIKSLLTVVSILSFSAFAEETSETSNKFNSEDVVSYLDSCTKLGIDLGDYLNKQNSSNPQTDSTGPRPAFLTYLQTGSIALSKEQENDPNAIRCAGYVEAIIDVILLMQLGTETSSGDPDTTSPLTDNKEELETSSPLTENSTEL